MKILQKSYKNEYADCLSYIDSYWDRVIHEPTERVINRHVITIPHPHFTPNPKWIGKFGYMFYWDSFFMFRGLIGTKREWLLQNQVDNFIYLFDNYGVIPNFNAHVSMGRSQPPFLSSMILDTYNGYYFPAIRKNKFQEALFNLKPHKKWLKKAVEVAKKEYEIVWIDKERLYNHSVRDELLARYGDRDIGYAHSSELESGWDFTSRFYNRCNQFFPIDLNVLLYKYERDFAKIAFHLEDRAEEKKWKDVAAKRKKEINRLMWNEKKGFFFDYCYTDKEISGFLSLASFTPLWAGLATKDQAARMVEKLPIFETDYGLVITAEESLAPRVTLDNIPERFRPALEEVLKPKQWDYPNIWPPLEYLTVVGLLKYGYVEDAKRIMQKSLKAHATLFRKYKTFLEKFNGKTGDRAANFHYDLQEGFGWTNAAFYRYVHLLDDLNEGKELYKQPKPEEPPYGLALLH
jgi:alpha,alpha-trehalase